MLNSISHYRLQRHDRDFNTSSSFKFSLLMVVMITFLSTYAGLRIPHFLAISIPSANVPTLASMAQPSLSNLRHSAHRSFSGTENVVMNSLSSSCGRKLST